MRPRALHHDRSVSAPDATRRFRSAITTLLLLGVLASVAVPATASPAPTWVCPVCDDPLEWSARGHGVDLTVASSTATAHVSENGTAVWTATVRVENASDLRELDDRGLLEETVERAFASGGPKTQVRKVSTEGNVLRVRYATHDTAFWSSGVLRYDGLRDDPGEYVYVGLGADRVTVVGPEEWTVARAPASGSVDGNRVTLTELPRGDGPFLVFAPPGVSFAGVRAFLTVATVLAPGLLRNVLLLLVLPAGLVAAGIHGERALAGRTLAGRDPRRIAIAVGVVGGLAAAHPLYVGVEPVLGSADPHLFAGGVATALLGGAASWRGLHDRVTFARLLVAATVAGFAGTISLLALAPAARYLTVDASSLVHVGLAIAPVLAMLPAGFDRGRRGVTLVVAVVLVAFVSRFDLLATGDYRFGLAGLFAVLYVAAILLGGLPSFLLGASLTRE